MVRVGMGKEMGEKMSLFIEPLVVRVKEYNAGLVGCLRDVVDNLENEEELTRHVRVLEEIVSNETTTQIFVDLGGVNLLVYILTVFPSNLDLGRRTLAVLQNVASSSPERNQKIAELGGPDALLDFITHYGTDCCIEAFMCAGVLAEFPKALETMISLKLEEVLVETVLATKSKTTTYELLNVLKASSVSDTSHIEQHPEKAVTQFTELLKSILASDDLENQAENARLIAEIMGNWCEKRGVVWKDAIHQAEGIHYMFELLKTMEQHNEIHIAGLHALSKFVANHEPNMMDLLNKKERGLDFLCEEVKKKKQDPAILVACFELLITVASLDSTTIDGPLESFSALQKSGTFELIQNLYTSRQGDTSKIAEFWGLIGLRPNLKVMIREAGVVRVLAESLSCEDFTIDELNASLSAMMKAAAGSLENKLQAGQKGAVEACVKLIRKHCNSDIKGSDLVVEHAIHLLAILSDGCQENVDPSSIKDVVEAVGKAMDARISDWKVQEHACNLFIKIAGSNPLTAELLRHNGLEKTVERVLSAFSGNMMVESGARTLLELLQSRRGRDSNTTGGPTIRRHSRTRAKELPNDLASQGGRAGRNRDHSLSPIRSQKGRRGSSVEPTRTRSSMRPARGGFALETVKE